VARGLERTRPLRASELLDAAGDFRSDIAARIEEALRENKELHGARPLSVYGGMAMTLYVWSPSAPRLGLSAEQHARAVMVAANETSRRLVELEYDDDAVLIGAHTKHVSLAGLNHVELERVNAAARSLQQRRLNQALAKGKIGRNDACPCGSGSKFKRCHGRR
jgi:preprotein translocase subunit SecA